VLRDLGDETVRARVGAFVAAWERADVDAVVALLADDAVITMPPYAEWYAGREDLRWFLSHVPLQPGRRWSCTPTLANGQVAVEKRLWDDGIGALLSHSVNVLTFDDRGDILRIDAFLDPELVR